VGRGNETHLSPLVTHGAKKYLWGNVPAVDILNLDENEGVNIPSPLRLLFAGMKLLLPRLTLQLTLLKHQETCGML